MATISSTIYICCLKPLSSNIDHREKTDADFGGRVSIFLRLVDGVRKELREKVLGRYTNGS